MNRISNIDNISNEYIDDIDFQSKMKSILIGDAIGCEKIYVNIDLIKPGGKSAKYHTHSTQEEFFLIMSGEGILRMDGEEILVKKGDVISKPAGKNIAHQFINNSLEILQILDVGTREKDDFATYPDENIILIRNQRLAYRIGDNQKNWTSDPNE